jgi:TPR repeat protein
MAAWGRALFNGTGAQRDTRKGLDLLLKAAAMGHIDAMFDLASIFKEGRNGTPADPIRAMAFLEAGIERQEVYSRSILGLPKRNVRTVALCKPKVVTKIVIKTKVVTKTVPAKPGNPSAIPKLVKPPQAGSEPAFRGTGGYQAGRLGGSGGSDGDGDGGSNL